MTSNVISSCQLTSSPGRASTDTNSVIRQSSRCGLCEERCFRQRQRYLDVSYVYVVQCDTGSEGISKSRPNHRLVICRSVLPPGWLQGEAYVVRSQSGLLSTREFKLSIMCISLHCALCECLIRQVFRQSLGISRVLHVHLCVVVVLLVTSF